MNTVARKRYPMIDICKFLCALLIVALHTKPFNTVFALDQGLAVLERFAVPFFFCATGFFLLDGNGKLSGNRMKKQIIRLCSMAVIWQAIYIPVCNPEILGGGVHGRYYSVPLSEESITTGSCLLKFRGLSFC